MLFPRPGCTGLPKHGGLEGRGGTRSHCGFHWAWSGHTNSCTRVALSVHSCSTYDDFLPRVSIILQGPEKHTNVKEYFPEKGFDVLPAVPGHRATSLSTGTAVNDDFRVGSGASPAILRPFRDEPPASVPTGRGGSSTEEPRESSLCMAPSPVYRDGDHT